MSNEPREQLNADVTRTASNTYVNDVCGKGRCVFAARDFHAGELILINHVLPYRFLPDDNELMEHSMQWTEDKDCIALGNINLISHSAKTNCQIENRHDLSVKVLTAKEDIRKDEELTINYACDLWFEVK